MTRRGLKYLLGEHLSVDSRSVHTFIIGEHGDSEIPVWSSSNVSGVPLHDFCEMRGFYDHDGAMEKIGESVKNSAYEIIERKKATYYGIGMAVQRICEAVVRDEKSILPVSTALHGEFGVDGVTLSIPPSWVRTAWSASCPSLSTSGKRNFCKHPPNFSKRQCGKSNSVPFSSAAHRI